MWHSHGLLDGACRPWPIQWGDPTAPALHQQLRLPVGGERSADDETLKTTGWKWNVHLSGAHTQVGGMIMTVGGANTSLWQWAGLMWCRVGLIVLLQWVGLMWKQAGLMEIMQKIGGYFIVCDDTWHWSGAPTHSGTPTISTRVTSALWLLPPLSAGLSPDWMQPLHTA